MTEIYIAIANQRETFVTIAERYTKDINEIDEAVQELMFYFLQMNPNTLKEIYDRDKIEGVVGYGAVALRRAFTSTRSNFYYKYKKYYENITHYNTDLKAKTSIENMPNPETSDHTWTNLEKIDLCLDDFHWYDKELFKLYYYEGNTLDSLAAKTKISRNSLFTTINKARRLIIKKLNNE